MWLKALFTCKRKVLGIYMVMAIRAGLCREGSGRMRMHGRRSASESGLSIPGMEITRNQMSSWVFLCLTSLSVLDGGYINISGELSHYLRIKIPSNEGKKEKVFWTPSEVIRGKNANEGTSGSTNLLLK